ncbi:MAG: hypothetical protein JWO38_3650 [Gemmataceae bacterium]|nr:hypothetical protein [Gemmataceae bacterium]
MAQQKPTDTRVVQLQVPPAVEERLREKAKLAGLSLEVYLEELAEQNAWANGHPDPLGLTVNQLTSRTPERIMADREIVLKTARPGRPLPEGKTLFDVVEGTWPGDETDEEIREMLTRLS